MFRIILGDTLSKNSPFQNQIVNLQYLTKFLEIMSQGHLYENKQDHILEVNTDNSKTLFIIFRINITKNCYCRRNQ